MDLPANFLPIIGTLLGTVLVAFLTQRGSAILEERRQRGARETKEIEVVNQREGREIEFATTLRNELKAQLVTQGAMIQTLQAAAADCNRKQLRTLQWLWRVNDALGEAGIHVELPADLTLDGFERPMFPTPAIPGLRPPEPLDPTVTVPEPPRPERPGGPTGPTH